MMVTAVARRSGSALMRVAADSVDIAQSLRNSVSRAAYSTGSSHPVKAPPVVQRVDRVLKVALDPEHVFEPLLTVENGTLRLEGEEVPTPHAFFAFGKTIDQDAAEYLRRVKDLTGDPDAVWGGTCVLKTGTDYCPETMAYLKRSGMNIAMGNHPKAGPESQHVVEEIGADLGRMPGHIRHVVFGIGGGTSALTTNDLEIADLRSQLMARGEKIGVLNSAIGKNRWHHGQMGDHVAATGRKYVSWVVNDVGNDLAAVGSGPTRNGRLISQNSSPQVMAAIRRAYEKEGGWIIHDFSGRETLSDESGEVAANFVQTVKDLKWRHPGKKQVLLADGEPVVSELAQVSNDSSAETGGRGTHTGAHFLKGIRGIEGVAHYYFCTDNGDGSMKTGGNFGDTNTFASCKGLDEAIRTGTTGRVLKENGFTKPLPAASNVRDGWVIEITPVGARCHPDITPNKSS